MAQSPTSAQWDTNYEWKIVLLLGIGFGLVGMDRFVIGPLWNTISTDLGLDPGAIGTLAGLTAVAWGTFAIVFGRLADKWGHRKILIWSIVGFSMLGGVSGLATSMMFFIMVRTILGLMEGGYTPTSFAAVAVASKPSRRGLNQGLQQCFISLLGLALAPIFATQMLAAGLSWRVIFVLIAAPGFIVAAILAMILKEPKDTMGAAALGVVESHGAVTLGSFFAPLALSYLLAIMASLVVALTLTPALSLVRPCSPLVRSVVASGEPSPATSRYRARLP
jgi:MFS family permease